MRWWVSAGGSKLCRARSFVGVVVRVQAWRSSGGDGLLLLAQLLLLLFCWCSGGGKGKQGG
jgi:hypothetical protein